MPLVVKYSSEIYVFAVEKLKLPPSARAPGAINNNKVSIRLSSTWSWDLFVMGFVTIYILYYSTVTSYCRYPLLCATTVSLHKLKLMGS